MSFSCLVYVYIHTYIAFGRLLCYSYVIIAFDLKEFKSVVEHCHTLRGRSSSFIQFTISHIESNTKWLLFNQVFLNILFSQLVHYRHSRSTAKKSRGQLLSFLPNHNKMWDNCKYFGPNIWGQPQTKNISGSTTEFSLNRNHANLDAH